MIERDDSILPEGYRFDGTPNIQPREVARVLRQAKLARMATARHVAIIEDDWRGVGAEVDYAGVRDEHDRLVGVGDIIHIGEHGQLGNFAVVPTHRHQGIGQAIIDRRLAIAEENGVDSIHIPPLMPGNSLRSYYLEQGFEETRDGELIRGPDPVPLDDIFIAIRNSQA